MASLMYNRSNQSTKRHNLSLRKTHQGKLISGKQLLVSTEGCRKCINIVDIK